MIDFLLKSAISLIVFLGFYYLILEREKIHKFNRFYLLISILISLIIPFVTFEFIEFVETAPVIQYDEPINIEKAKVVLNQNPTIEKVITAQESIDYLPYVFWSIYVSISFIFLFRFGKNYFKLIVKSKINPSLKYKNANLILLNEKILPHTFLNFIFINSEDFKNKNIEDELFAHEMVHVNQKHTLDILFIEFLKALFWFHPLFYLYKKAIQLNHEFLADEEIVNTYNNVPYYQNLLLHKSNGNTTIYLASNLNYLITKKRLLMMTKNTSKKIALLKKVAIIPILAGLISFFCIEIIAQEKPKVLNLDTEKTIPTDKDKIRDAYYSGVYVKICDEKTNRKSVTLYEKLSLEDKRKYLGNIPEIMIEKEIPEPLFEKMKTKDLAVWINGKVKTKDEIKKYKRTDFSYYAASFVHENARSKRFRQSYQYTLFTKEYFNENLKKSHTHFSGDTIKITWVSYETIMKDKFMNKAQIDTTVWWVDGKEDYNLFVNDNIEEFIEDEKIRQKRDFAYENIIITIVDKKRNINVTKKYEDLDLKIKQRYLHTHMFYQVEKKIPTEKIFEKFKNENKYLIFINDKRVENSELQKMNNTDIYYFSEMVNPPTSTREHLYFLYTKEFYVKELSGQLKNKSKSKIKIIIT